MPMPSRHTSTRNVAFELHGIRPLTSTAPWRRSLITEPSAGSTPAPTPPIAARAHVTFGIHRAAADRARRTAGGDELGGVGDEGGDLLAADAQPRGRGGASFLPLLG